MISLLLGRWVMFWRIDVKRSARFQQDSQRSKVTKRLSMNTFAKYSSTISWPFSSSLLSSLDLCKAKAKGEECHFLLRPWRGPVYDLPYAQDSRQQQLWWIHSHYLRLLSVEEFPWLVWLPWLKFHQKPICSPKYWCLAIPLPWLPRWSQRWQRHLQSYRWVLINLNFVWQFIECKWQRTFWPDCHCLWVCKESWGICHYQRRFLPNQLYVWQCWPNMNRLVFWVERLGDWSVGPRKERPLHRPRTEQVPGSVCRFNLRLMLRSSWGLVLVLERKGLAREQLRLRRRTWPILGYVWRGRIMPMQRLLWQWGQTLRDRQPRLQGHLNQQLPWRVEWSVWLRLWGQRQQLSYRISTHK